MSLLLNWKPSGLHVPYYVAKAKGYYEQAGAPVSQIEAGQGSDFSAKQVGLGNVPFAVTSADQVLNVRSRGLSPRSVGVMMQRSPVVVFTTRQTFGGKLTNVDQLEGKTVGTGPGMVKLLTRLLLKEKGVLSQVELVDTGYDTVQQLLGGKIDAAGGVFGDAVVARQKGKRVSSVSVAEAIPSYGHVVATEESYAKQNAGTVRSFLRATARGAAWATNNPGKATDILVKAEPSLAETREVQRAKWEQMARSYVLSNAVREHGWGWSESKPWQTMYRALRDGGLLGGKTDPAAAWTNDHLPTDARAVGEYASLVSVGRSGTTTTGGTTTATGNTTTTSGG